MGLFGNGAELQGADLPFLQYSLVFYVLALSYFDAKDRKNTVKREKSGKMTFCFENLFLFSERCDIIV